MHAYLAMIRFVLASVTVLVAVGSSGAIEPKDGANSSATSVEQLLLEESKGAAVDRSQLVKLAELDDFTRWQAGTVKLNGDWISIDRLSSANAPILREYVERRAAEKTDVEGHRRLALWCRKHGLDLQAAAHWHALLDLHSNDLEARRMLGHKFVDGNWFSPEQLEKADRDSAEYLDGLRKWLPACQAIAKALEGDNDQKARALKRLRDIDNEGAIPALEQMAMQASEATAAPWVLAIAKYRSASACLTLARIALSEPNERSKLAMSKLKDYPREMVVPELLGLLATPIETKVRYGVNDLGELMIHRALFRTTKSEKQLVEFERLVRVNSPVQAQLDFVGVSSRRAQARSYTTRIGLESKAFSNVDIKADELAAAKLAAEDQARFELEIAEANSRNEVFGKRVYQVLRHTTGEAFDDSPQAWWEWWRKANYRSLTDKPYNRRKYQQIDQTPLTLSEIRFVETDIVVSCLVAGTTVQTSDGLKPIEQIRVGDMVVSQDVESGKLDLKPVLRTTVREPEKIYRIHTESGDIRATGGHRWWVAGKGWVMSIQLEPDMLFHNAKGTTKILSVEEEADPLPTHNLVVDDYHTYFVGTDRVLSFDNVDPIPTLRKVPGY